MNCPKCNHPVKQGQSVCENCGETIMTTPVMDGNLVYYPEELTRKKRGISKKTMMVIALIAVVLAVAAFLAVMYFSTENKQPPSPSTADSAATTVAVTDAPTAAPTEAPTAAPTAAPTEASTDAASSAAPTSPAAPQTEEEKLVNYLETSGMLKTLLAAADDKTSVSATAEHNILLVNYRIEEDSASTDQTEYFEKQKENYENLSKKMDKPVYQMKKDSGVPEAVLEIHVVDRNDVEVYSNIID